MIFSSITFLYYFLPLLLIVYFLVPKKCRNIILLVFSLSFYFYGETKYIIILLLSCIINYIIALLIEKYRDKAKYIFALDLVINIGMLIYFKYTDFIIGNINNIFNININLKNIILPLGISFFTFQTMSYVIDVYNKKVVANKSLINFATYVCLFPQLIAGPIIRYKDIEEELKNRETSMAKFSNGVRRFCIGLGKKVLIANVIGELYTSLFATNNPTILTYWLGAISFMLQIYYDFSGYSDMAIGLGKMFGFEFCENFNYPFISNSITEFWRRWHISLSTWFKDYVYIFLGGNRVSKLKWVRNILIVFFLTGLWHGASWNFIIWGLYFGIILIIEKLFLKDYLTKHKIISYIYTLFLLIISFVIFNTNNLNELIIYFKGMLGIGNINLWNNEVIYYLKSYFIIIVISIVGSTPIIKKIGLKIQKYFSFIEPVFYIGILLLVTAFLVDSSFNPFLYFRF